MIIVKNRQFYIYKLSSTFILDNKQEIDLPFLQARSNKQVVAVADNQVFRSIRDIQNRTIDKEFIEGLFNKRDEIKKQPHSKLNSSLVRTLNKNINESLFIPEYISVVIDVKKHYNTLFSKGFTVNGQRYKRFSCSAPQARVNTVIFVSEDVYDVLYKRIKNDIIEKPIVPAKFNAYFGLSTSATFQVSEPRVCVVPDSYMTRSTLVNWVTEVEGELADDIIEEKEVDIEYNLFDGMGLITPRQAMIWATDLGLDYMPSQFCIRNSYIKGMVCVFDILDFCQKKNDGNYIIDTLYKDSDGKPIKVDLRQVDVILTESQFKMWNCYNNYEHYKECCDRNKLTWGVSKFSAKHDSNNLFLNYQSIQTLDLDYNDIVKLCEKTVEWISGVNYEDVNYSILFNLGKGVNEKSILNTIQSSDNYWLKSMLLNNELRKDPYIVEKIYNSISTKITNAAIGRVLVRGNYQTMVSDPYALMEHICGLEVKGLLANKEHYSGYWNKLDVREVDSMRSPLTYKSEHNILNFNPTEEQDYWYRYNQTGIIYNVWGDDVLKCADSDWDFDIIASSDNPILLKGVYRDLLPVTSAKKTANKTKINPKELMKADLQAFGSSIGTITNRSTSTYSMMYDAKEVETLNEMEKRLILFRIAQGHSIDSAKGIITKAFPKHWIRYNKIEDSDTQEVIDKKNLYNSILIEKKPYFFKYIYGSVKSEYSKFIKSFRSTIKYRFNMDVYDFVNKKNFSEEELPYYEFYKKKNPVIDNGSVMNVLCHYIERFKTTVKKNNAVDTSIYKYYMNIPFEEFDHKLYRKVKATVEQNRKEVGENIFDNDFRMRFGLSEGELSTIDHLDPKLIEELSDLCSDNRTLVNYLVYLYYFDKTSYSKEFLWKNYGKWIYDNVYFNSDKKVKYPSYDENGQYYYMYDRFTIKEVDITD